MAGDKGLSSSFKESASAPEASRHWGAYEKHRISDLTPAVLSRTAFF